jgi:hypothetical protein
MVAGGYLAPRGYSLSLPYVCIGIVRKAGYNERLSSFLFRSGLMSRPIDHFPPKSAVRNELYGSILEHIMTCWCHSQEGPLMFAHHALLPD